MLLAGYSEVRLLISLDTNTTLPGRSILAVESLAYISPSDPWFVGLGGVRNVRTLCVVGTTYTSCHLQRYHCCHYIVWDYTSKYDCSLILVLHIDDEMLTVP